MPADGDADDVDGFDQGEFSTPAHLRCQMAEMANVDGEPEMGEFSLENSNHIRVLESDPGYKMQTHRYVSVVHNLTKGSGCGRARFSDIHSVTPFSNITFVMGKFMEDN